MRLTKGWIGESRKNRTKFHVLATRDGGPGLKGARELLAAAGIETVPAPEGSELIGHAAFYVLGGKRMVARAEKLLWG